MTDRQERQERFMSSPGARQTATGAESARRRKSVAFDIPENDSPSRIEKSARTPTKKASLGSEFEGDRFDFGFKPGQEETLDLTFNSAEKPNFGHGANRGADEMDIDGESTGRRPSNFDKDLDALFDPKSQPRISSGDRMQPPPARKISLRDSYTPTRAAKQQNTYIYSPSVGRDKPAELSDIVMDDYYDWIQGEGAFSEEDIRVEKRGGTERPKMARRSLKPSMETVPEERVPMKRDRTMSWGMTEELFGPRKSVAQASEAQGQRASMVSTTALCATSQPQVPRRPSISLTTEFPGPADSLDRYPTVKEFFEKTLDDNADVDKWFRDSDPPTTHTPDLRCESRADMIVRMVKNRIKLQKYEMGMKWVMERRRAMKNAFDKWHRDTDADPKSSTLFPWLEKFKEAWGNPQAEAMLDLEVDRKVQMCDEIAKEEWRQQLLKMEEWHAEALGRAVQDLEAFNKRICEKLEAAKKEEEKRKVVQVKLKELADLKALSAAKRQQLKEKKNKAWEDKLRSLEIQKEILETRVMRKAVTQIPGEKELHEITNELTILFALQPFTLKEISNNLRGNLDVKASVEGVFHVTMENLPKPGSKVEEQSQATITIQAGSEAARRPQLYSTLCALADLPKEDQGHRQQVKVPHPMLQYFLQNKLQALKTIVSFVTEIDAFWPSPATFLGWQLAEHRRFLFQFGNVKAGCLVKLFAHFCPEVYPHCKDSLKFAVEIGFKKKGVELSEGGILNEVGSIKSGVGYITRVLEKMAGIVDSVLI